MAADRIFLCVLLARVWADVAGDPARLDRVSFTGAETVLPSVYDVTGWAAATIAAARLAAAELRADDGGIVVDRGHACATFLAELLFETEGWERPAIWDPIAGDYSTADGGWVRLHTNYAHHRAAALAALGVEPDGVAAAVAARTAEEVESAVVDAGGCAAAMRSLRFDEPVVSLHDIGPGAPRSTAQLRVLDLTRVLAGPQCTRFLSLVGASVLRIDPPGFEEFPALLPETTAGKRCAFLDVHRDIDTFDQLVREADVLVCGLRPGAVDVERARELNPSLVVARLDAYGWTGPWAGRRGFDSLVQMTTGIAARGMEVYGADRPTPLPAQALDHGTGFALAAGVCRALCRLREEGVVSEVRASLVGAANELVAGGEVDDPSRRDPAWPAPDLFEHVETPWGAARRVRPVEGVLSLAPGPLGRDEPRWR